MLLAAHSMGASGPRFISGSPYFTGPNGVPIGWKQPNLLYFTDPGGLGPAVNHQAADALVAAAAGVWNLPVASISVAQGGVLAEHVSGQNAYLDSAGMVFPADVMVANAAAIPVAVIYDTDGSVTDLLLGSGASDPNGCRQNGVTGTVDWFDPAGYIGHALIVVNGRCSGPAPELRLELQYQLMRAFGRVLGLAWSQTNDNVFTGTPQPTPDQELRWPIMHPMDVICGLYSYACMLNPFQLRPDDIASMVGVYGISQSATPAAGKQVSLAQAVSSAGVVAFPTGEGMAGVNVLVAREAWGAVGFEAWSETSAVTGTIYRTNGSSPFVPADTGPSGSFGGGDGSRMGYYLAAYVPVDGVQGGESISISMEAINPLYRGSYALGPYEAGAVAPSGSPAPQTDFFVYNWGGDYLSFPVADAAATCGNGEDGTSNAPMTVTATGWWKGLLCGHGHASYVAANVKPARTFTIEVTALDGNGFATEGKAMPVIGFFGPNDGWGALPSLGVAPAAFQSFDIGMTTLSAATGQLSGLRFGIADQRGDGRPDYPYQARLFYADDVAPAQVPAGGGQITISGMGFRAGNAVTINGVAAAVVSWTPTTIVAIAPAMAAAGAANLAVLDIEVRDLSTGATSTMTGVFEYNGAPKLPNSMRIVTVQAATAYSGVAVPVAFEVQVVAPDGVTPVAGDAVSFSATGVGVTFAACGAAVCVVATDAKGMASTGVTPRAAGTANLTATDGSLLQSAAFPVIASAGSMVVLSAPSGNLPVGDQAAVAFSIQVLPADGVMSMGGRTIAFSVPAGSASFSGCVASVCAVTTNGQGQAQLYVTPTAAGPVRIEAADGSVTGTASFVATPDPDVMTTTQSPSASLYVGGNAGKFTVNLLRGDGSGPDVNEAIVFTAPAGISLNPCGANVCTVETPSWGGSASVGIFPSQAGTFTIQAAFGAVTQSVSIAVLPHARQLVVLSAPSGDAPVGRIDPTPFTVQVLDDGLPAPNVPINWAGVESVAVLSACNFFNPTCTAYTDGNGTISTLVEPLATGAITISAVYAPQMASANITGVGVGTAMTVTEQPGAAGVWVGDDVPLAIEVLGPGGVAPAIGDIVFFSVLNGNFSFPDGQYGVRREQTDENGVASVVGAAAGPGPVSILATDGWVSQMISFPASLHTDTMRLVQAPASGATVGVMAPQVFQVQVLEADGVTPVGTGRNITVGAISGSAALSYCGNGPSCVLPTNSLGMVATPVTPLAAGTIVLAASEAGTQLTASFTAVGPGLADLFSVAATPGVSVYAGAVSAVPLQAQVLLADGVTPVRGIGVAFSIVSGGGTALFNSCGGPACTGVTDANGLAATLVTGGTAGALSLVATASLPTGLQSLTVPFQVMANQFAMTALNPRTFIYAGATIGLLLHAAAIENGTAAANQSVQWSGSAGMLTATPNAVTNAAGMSSVEAALGPLDATLSASMSACAWSGVCAQFTGMGVGAQSLGLVLVSGGRQSIAGTAAPAAVVAMVVDGSGNPVVAAPVDIYQTVRALDAACPANGRCPAAAILGTQAQAMVSGIDGKVTIMPLLVSGRATQTEITVAAGTAGFATAVVADQP